MIQSSKHLSSARCLSQFLAAFVPSDSAKVTRGTCGRPGNCSQIPRVLAKRIKSRDHLCLACYFGHSDLSCIVKFFQCLTPDDFEFVPPVSSKCRAKRFCSSQHRGWNVKTQRPAQVGIFLPSLTALLLDVHGPSIFQNSSVSFSGPHSAFLSRKQDLGQIRYNLDNSITVSRAAAASLLRDRRAGVLRGWSEHRAAPASLLHPWALLA